MSRNKDSPLETKHLISGAAGMLCPLPIVGEALVAYGLYPVVRNVKLLGNNPVSQSAASLAVASLARLSFYAPFYIPAMNYVIDLFR